MLLKLVTMQHCLKLSTAEPLYKNLQHALLFKNDPSPPPWMLCNRPWQKITQQRNQPYRCLYQ